MAIGVPYDLFWVLTPKELEPFKKAFLISQDIDQQIEDASNWQLGNYIREAIASSLDSKHKYPKEPYMYTAKKKESMSKKDLTRKGRENNELVKLKLLERINKRKLKSSGGD